MSESIPNTGEKWHGSVFTGPDDSPGFNLWRNFLNWQRQLNSRLKPFGLTQPQFAILAVCGWLMREGKQVTQHSIAHFSGMDRMHISQIVARLEVAGLLIKSANLQDQRSNLISLSEEGQRQLQNAMPIVEAFDKAFFS